MIEDPESKNMPIDDAATDGFFREIDVQFLVHELKDPVSVIETALRMLLEKTAKYGSLTDRQEKTLRRALRNSKKARHLLADLLEVGRSDSGCILCHRFDPVVAVDEVLMEALETADEKLWEALQGLGAHSDRKAFLKAQGIHLICSDPARRAGLCQDEVKFRQIVGNLIKNGLRHRHRRLDLDIGCQAERLILEVRDDGPGVNKEHRELIFERYTRINACVILSRTGHGLGLAGARILARRLGGDITVENNRGPGAAFRLTLPLELDQHR